MHAKWKSSTSPLPTAESNDPRPGRSQLRIHAFPSRQPLFAGTPAWHRGGVPRSRGALCPRERRPPNQRRQTVAISQYISSTTELREPARPIPYARHARTHRQTRIDQIAVRIGQVGFTNPGLVDNQRGHFRRLDIHHLPTHRQAGARPPNSALIVWGFL